MYKILHVETSLTYQALIKNISGEIGVVYSNARTVEEALSRLSENDTNLIITAMEIEGANSSQLVDAINKSQYKNIPIVVITGTDTPEDRKKMYEMGIVDYISKRAGAEQIKYSLLAYKNEDDILGRIRELKIAVCDDSSMDRYIFERIFNMSNIKNVDYYESGEALLSSSIVYDVYLIDMVLKTMSGNQIVRKIRETGSESVIMAISGIDHYKTIANILDIGANDYITKPFNNELFLARLKSNVRGYLLLQEVKQKTRQLEQMAITDGLTGVYNRRHILFLLDKEIKKSERSSNCLSIMMIDIDHFKKINDTYGHQFGDSVLIRVSEAAQKAMRETDMFGRYGGEEFIIVFPDTDLSGALATAERIRKSMEHIKSNRPEFSVSISGGVVQWSGQSLKDIIMEADTLLYSAKKNGRNRIERN